MKSGIVKPNPRIKTSTRDVIVRSIGFLALVALLAMASLPITSGQRDLAAANTAHWSGPWHG